MKYTKQQAEKLKSKGMDGFTKYNRPLPDVQIVDGFYIVPSKMNTKQLTLQFTMKKQRNGKRRKFKKI